MITDAELAEFIEQWRPWFYKTAKSLIGNQQGTFATLEDLVQAGHIAAWKTGVMCNDIEKRQPWMLQAARWAMFNVIRTQLRLGDREVPIDVVDPNNDYLWGVCDGGLTSVEDSLDIRNIVNTLTTAQRNWVYLKFWGGCLGSEIKSEHGICDTMWAQRDKGIRAKLIKQLEHLGTNNGSVD